MNKLFFTLLFLALAAYGQTQERIAIINTLDDYDSISVSALAYLTDRLRETAVNVLPSERFGIMTTESIVAFLGSMENTVRVCKESSCLAELGRQVSADYVAQGRIGRFNENLTIRVELYSVVSGNLMGSFTGESKDIAGLRDIINENAADLFKRMLAEPKAPTKPSEPTPAVVPVAPPAPPPVDIAKIQTLIKQGVKKNKEQIQKESIGLSPKEISVLYEENKKGGFPCLLNFLTLGSGLGSYIQGDITFGIIHSAVFVVGGALILSVVNDINAANDAQNGDPAATMSEKQANKILDKFYISSITVGFNMIISAFTPMFYMAKYNKELKEALNDYSIVASINPLIVPSNHPKNGIPAVGLAFNVRY